MLVPDLMDMLAELEEDDEIFVTTPVGVFEILAVEVREKGNLLVLGDLIKMLPQGVCYDN